MQRVEPGSDNARPDDDLTYRDSSGRSLADYPRPSVAVDTALLTVLPDAAGGHGGTLGILQVRRAGGRGWALPGTFLHAGERLADAVRRSLRDKAGVRGLAPRQLQVFDDPTRDERGWVLSVAHIDVCPVERLSERHPDSTRLVPTDVPGRMPYGHGAIIELAVDELRGRYRDHPDPDRLLPVDFTLRQLRLVHEAVAGEPLQRDTFRRSMESGLAPTGRVTEGGRGRPAELFQRH